MNVGVSHVARRTATSSTAAEGGFVHHPHGEGSTPVSAPPLPFSNRKVTMKYRKKPVEIEAVHFSAYTEALAGWQIALKGEFPDGKVYTFLREGGAQFRVAQEDPGPAYLLILTLEGWMRADVGDWIIRGVKGEHYPCKPDVFALTYEAVPE